MFEYERVEVGEALTDLEAVATGDAVRAIVARGFTPVGGLRRHTRYDEQLDQIAAMLDPEDMDTPAILEQLDALRAQQLELGQARPLDVFFAAPDGRSFLAASTEGNTLTRELLTTFANGSRCVTVEVSSLIAPILAEGGLKSWPEGGSWWRAEPSRELDQLLATHAAFVDEVAATEHSEPVFHQSFEDVVLHKRNGIRLSKNNAQYDAMIELQELAEDPDWDDVPPDPLGLIRAVADAAETRQHRQNSRALRRSMLRVPLQLASTHRLREASEPSLIAMWHHWADDDWAETVWANDEMDAGRLPLREEELNELLTELVASVAENNGLPTPPAHAIPELARVFRELAMHLDFTRPMTQQDPVPDALVQATHEAFDALGWPRSPDR